MTITNSKLPINLHDLLRQRTVEGERVEYKAGWNQRYRLTTTGRRWLEERT